MDVEPQIIAGDDRPPDIGTIRAEDWPSRQLTPLPRQRRAGFQVVFQHDALKALHAHGQSVTDMEIGGLLIGHVFRDQHGPFLHITAAIEGRHATHHAAQVTFTSATWDYVHQVLESDYPGQKIVGWYHTHPDFGVFLSGMDLFIQDNFFNLPWQVAFVYDPVRREEGVFVWKNGKSERVPHLVHKGGHLSSGEQSMSIDPPVDEAGSHLPAGRITPPAPAEAELNPIEPDGRRWGRLRNLVAGFVNGIEGQRTGQWRDRS